MAATTGDNEEDEESSHYSLSIQNVPDPAQKSANNISTNS